jgi:hypothetical protein
MNNQPIPAEPPFKKGSNACTQGHAWQPTIILGYFQCACCSRLAACKVCVSRVRGKAMIGYCQAHQHLRTPDNEEEVLG